MSESRAYVDLLEWSRAYEYYADAYVGDDAPFRSRQPDADTLCRIIQEGTRIAHRLLSEHTRLLEKVSSKS